MEKIMPVIFRIGDGLFGLDINKVQAIELYSSIVPVPNAVAYVDGIINIRGEVIPIYNLRARCHYTSEYRLEDEQYIIVTCQGEKLALMVDSVEDIKDVKDENMQDLPVICQGTENTYMIGIAHLDEGLAIIIDVDKLMTAEQMETLNKVVKD